MRRDSASSAIRSFSTIFLLFPLVKVFFWATMSKALEILMRDQIVCFLESVDALDVFQSGFRSGHSTVTTLLNITDDIYGYLDRGLFVVMVLLDFSKAFDPVERFFDFSSSAVGFLR
jgi:hypothetical protein